MSAVKNIRSAFVYGKDGKVFAAYAPDKNPDDLRRAPAQDGPNSLHEMASATSPGGGHQEAGEGLAALRSLSNLASPPATHHSFSHDRLDVFQPVILDGEILGTILLRSDLHELYFRLTRTIVIAGSIMLVALLAALALSTKFQGVISVPILKLAEKMKLVSVVQDYSLRMEKRGEDEIGVLIDGFNEMLSQVKERDERLRRHRDRLEEEVALRTAELSASNRDLELAIQEVKESQEHLQTLMDSTQAGVLMVEAESRRIVDANLFAQKLLGFSHLELLGESCFRFFSSEETAGPPGSAPGTAADPSESYMIKSDGTRIPILRTAVPLMKQGKKYLIESFFDLTELKQKEEELRKAKDAAEAASRAKSQFLANMSHEIRTPMNGVLGMTELLMKTELTERQNRFASTVYSSAKTLLNILNDILDFSKIEAGKLELEQITFDLPLLVEEVVELLAEGAQTKGLEFICSLAPGLPRLVQGDPNRLRQILMNLLSNAIKFTSSGEVVVRVDLVEDKGEEVRVGIEVQDTGIGIESEAQAQIFESFHQADGSTTRNFGGTGLGLAIVKRLTEMMDGTVTLKSEPGRGSTFRCTVRLQKFNEAPLTEHQPSFCLQGVRVLVVDDNVTNREILDQLVSAWGMRTDTAADGHEALEMLQAAARQGEPYHLAILDMQMPGLDGIELANAIKANPAIAAVRLIMLTSLGAYGSIQEARKAGIVAYLTKPVLQSHLFNCLVPLMRDQIPDDPQMLSADLQIRFPGRVLVVEDNLVNQEVARAMLESFGCQVDSAFNGQEALEAVSRGQYELVFMDCQMPQLDGFETTARIREQEAQEDRPRNIIIAMTAHAMEGDREKCLAAGMDDYLGKPFTQEELQRTLVRWLPLRIESRKNALSDKEDRAPAGGGPLDSRVLDQINSLQSPAAPDILGRVIQAYLEETPPLLAKLQEAVQKGDPEEAQTMAHCLKSSSANIGALNLSALCKELEILGLSHSLERAAGLADHINLEHDRVSQALRQELLRRGS